MISRGIKLLPAVLNMTRRMITLIMIALGFATACRATQVPPNILIILTDDQGFGDVGFNCENSTGMCARTPHMDALATGKDSAYFHRFYAAAGVCSPTRAALLTGRSNRRDCIYSALACDQENPAPTCAQGSTGALPWSEFTVAKAAKKSTLGDYATIQLGKWHLGDLWDKKLPDMNRKWPVSSPGDAGFDEWVTTEAEASSSMSNCGCFPVHHAHPGPKPPSGYPNISPDGDKCVVGGGVFSDWAYPCTDYFYPNASDPRNVTDLAASYKVPGDDSEFIVDRFAAFLEKTVKVERRPFLAHLCMHSIHEPHPSMPQYYDLYERDPDYLGTLTQLDVQIGRIIALLDEYGVTNRTAVFFTADNGPHQGAERTDIHWSTAFLRQCKASIFEGGLRVPGILKYPALIRGQGPLNVTTPVQTTDFLPTIMELLGGVASDNPTWPLDGASLLPVVARPDAPRATPLVFSWGGQSGVIDNDWKIVTKPAVGQCTKQAGFDFNSKDKHFLFNLADDYHELHDLKASEPAQFARMLGLLTDFLASVDNSQANETRCVGAAPHGHK